MRCSHGLTMVFPLILHFFVNNYIGQVLCSKNKNVNIIHGKGG